VPPVVARQVSQTRQRQSEKSTTERKQPEYVVYFGVYPHSIALRYHGNSSWAPQTQEKQTGSPSMEQQTASSAARPQPPAQRTQRQEGRSAVVDKQ
jgi:hypothetical protein